MYFERDQQQQIQQLMDQAKVSEADNVESGRMRGPGRRTVWVNVESGRMQGPGCSTWSLVLLFCFPLCLKFFLIKKNQAGSPQELQVNVKFS